MGTGALPYTLDLKVEPRQVKYKDTGWQDVRITDLPAGESLTISLTLDTNTTASHDSWVYLDLADIIPPVVSITSPAQGSLHRTDPVLNFAATDEAGGSGRSSDAAGGQGRRRRRDRDLGRARSAASSEGAHTVTVAAADEAGNKGMAASSTFTLDRTPPVTAASGSPAANAAGWNSGPVTVTLTATDATSGVATTYFKVNDRRAADVLRRREARSSQPTATSPSRTGRRTKPATRRRRTRRSP